MASSLVPFGDTFTTQGFKSPYYNETHTRFRKAVREFVEKEIKPFCHEWDENKNVPREVLRKMYEAGILPGAVTSKWPTEYAGENIAGGIKPSEFDIFHELIVHDEVTRCGSGGVTGALLEGISVCLTPVWYFGSKYLKEKVCKDVITGQKQICLCVTEPHAGSDVAGLKAEAKKSSNGKTYILNAEKKWITNGMYADYFVVAARTGGEKSGQAGLSLFLVEKGMPGLNTRAMKCGGCWSSGTAYVTLEDVEVPAENLIGRENEGFKYIMYGFNHERWMMIVEGLRMCRVCYEDAFAYANKRHVFGKPLIEQQAIRIKLMNMARNIEANQAWLDQITYQMKILPLEEANKKLGATIALQKANVAQLVDAIAREAVQVFGGLGYTRGGQGERVERTVRDTKILVIGGGAEDVLLDFAGRQSVRLYKTLLAQQSPNSKL